MTLKAARELTILLLLVTLGLAAFATTQAAVAPESRVEITYGEGLPEGFSPEKVEAALGGEPVPSWAPVTVHVTTDTLDRYDTAQFAGYDADVVLTTAPTLTLHEYQTLDAAGEDVDPATTESVVARESFIPWFDRDDSVVSVRQIEALYDRNRDFGHDAGAVAAVARAVAPLTYDGPTREPLFWWSFVAASGVATGVCALLWLRAVRARAAVLRTVRRGRVLTSRVLLGLDAVELSHLTVPAERRTPRLARSWETLRTAAKGLVARDAHLTGFGDDAVRVEQRHDAEDFVVEAQKAEAEARALVAASEVAAGTVRAPRVLDEVAGHLTEPARQALAALEASDLAEDDLVAERMDALREAVDALLRRLEAGRQDPATLFGPAWEEDEQAIGTEAERLLRVLLQTTGTARPTVLDPTSERLRRTRLALSLTGKPKNSAAERVAELQAALASSATTGGHDDGRSPAASSPSCASRAAARPTEAPHEKGSGRPGRRAVVGRLVAAILVAVPLVWAFQPDRDPDPARPFTQTAPADPEAPERTVRFDGEVPEGVSEEYITEERLGQYLRDMADYAPSEVVVAFRTGEDYITEKTARPAGQDVPGTDTVSYMVPRKQSLDMQRALLEEFPELQDEATGEPRPDTVLWPVMLWEDGTFSVMSPLVGGTFEGQPTGVAQLGGASGVVTAPRVIPGERDPEDNIIAGILDGQRGIERMTTSVPVTAGPAPFLWLAVAVAVALWALLLALVWAWRMVGDLPAGLRGRTEAAGALREARRELERLMVHEDDRALNTVVLEVGEEDTAEAAGRRLYDNALVAAWRESEDLASTPRRERRDPEYRARALRLREQARALGRQDEDAAQRASGILAGLG